MAKFVCDCCGREVDEVMLTEIQNGDCVCNECLNDTSKYVRCDVCNEWIPADEADLASDGNILCEDCRDEGYFICEKCGELHPLDEEVEVNDDCYWCQECADRFAYRCRDCGRWYTSAYMWDTDAEICDNCSADYYHCEDCGAVISVYDAHVDEYGDAYCDDCYERRNRPQHIHNYGYKPAPDLAFRKGEDENACLTYGLELEVDKGEDANEAAGHVHDIAEGRVYCKHDGSLDDGFEIVSHPASLAYHMYQMRWKGIVQSCIKDGFKSHDTRTCGLHIHVGRRGLGAGGAAYGRDADKVAANLVLLADHLQDGLVVFSRRTGDTLSRWAAFPNLRTDVYDPSEGSYVPKTDAQLTQDALRTERNGRYQAVNLCNTGTVEFRIFRGTLKRDTIIASIQLVDNMAKFAMEHTPTECVNATMEDVVNVRRWPELIEYMTSRGMLQQEQAAV